MDELTARDWRVILDALETLHYDANEDPDDYREGAVDALAETIEKVKVRDMVPESPVYVVYAIG